MDLESLSDDQLKEALNEEVIFARVAPEQKYRVVSNLQEMGQIVAVTGDGRTEKQSVFKVGLFRNRSILFGIAFEILSLSAIIYVPLLQGVFNTAPIGLKEWVFLIILPVPIVLIEEIRKAVSRRYGKMKKQKK